MRRYSRDFTQSVLLSAFQSTSNVVGGKVFSIDENIDVTVGIVVSIFVITEIL